MAYELRNRGFNDVDKIEHFLFDRMLFVISLKPFAVPHIEFEGAVTDFSDAAGGSGLGRLGDLFEPILRQINVEVDLDLVRAKGLD